MSPDDPPTTAHDHEAIARRAMYADAAEIVAHWRSRRTARAVLVLSFVAPVHVRKPPHQGNPPEGWTRTLIASHLLTELNGVWWIPSCIVDHVAKFTGVS
jgi:hypothetical protein